MSVVKNLFVDRRYRIPRIWSNNELKKFAHLFKGDIANVSGWKDIDKQGKKYKDYFVNANNYIITNYKKEARGFQGYDGEIFLDLEKEIPENLKGKFDVVFNHTTLEHIFNVKIAFSNLCKLSNDIVILVVPFLQQMHADYGDYWRFTPLTIKKMFKKNNMELLYLNYNDNKNASVYIFAIATKCYDKWKDKINIFFFDKIDSKPYIGCYAIQNYLHLIRKYIRKIFSI